MKTAIILIVSLLMLVLIFAGIGSCRRRMRDYLDDVDREAQRQLHRRNQHRS